MSHSEYNQGYHDAIGTIIDMLKSRANDRTMRSMAKGDYGNLTRLLNDEDNSLIELLQLKISE